jgi:hypothetical protein
MRGICWNLLVCCLLAFSCKPSLPEEVQSAYEELPEALDFNVHVKPVLSDKCFACHGPDQAAIRAGLRLDMPESAFGELPESPGKVAIKPGNLFKSELVHRILSDDPHYTMPSPESNLSLSPKEKAILIKWVEQGAEYKKHWAFIPPVQATPPTIKDQNWAKNPIDQFVGRKLEEAGISPSPEADKETLLRRVKMDLTGLPPTVQEIESFLADQSPEAYEKMVDRFLAAPHYGEKMAMHWMDIARFADTHGYTVDRYRDMSPYRDWVIKAYNENLPYDQFITYQVAGDLLPHPTQEQLLATAFNRIHPQNMEGGIVEEEFRVEYVVDRTHTLGQAFLAMTLGCARCHDHKYDPISQKEFFELSSFFNNVDEAGQISWDNAMPVPTMLFTDEKKDQLLSYLASKKDKEEEALEALRSSEEPAFQNWLNSGAYRQDAAQPFPQSRVAHFDFDQKELVNRLGSHQRGTTESNEAKNQVPVWTEGYLGKAVKLDGDAWLDLAGTGVYSKSEPFSVSIWIHIPQELTDGVIFHKGSGAVLYNYRGYHLTLKDNQLELLMAHTAPYNSLRKVTQEGVPRDQWINLIMTYDGSAKAAGLKVYLDGEEMATVNTHDNLYKDILFAGDRQPGLQVGAVWRGKGLKDALVDEVSVYEQQLSPVEILQISKPDAYRQLLSKQPEQFSQNEKAGLLHFYLNNYSQPYRLQVQRAVQQRKIHADSVEGVQEVMIMQEMEEPRPTYVLLRGEYHAHGEEVHPNTPQSILPMADELPKNRLGLAQWLIAPEHPLTARVAVNRFWQNFFGRGLVATSGDFGNQGGMPSHPELLDWLALEFIASGWDAKAMQKLIVMSATYQQASLPRKELEAMDPENVLLAKGSSLRMIGEMIRDNVLFASGLLDLTVGGTSVYPYQPDGLWWVNGAVYRQGQGKDLYRRSLYTIWKRSVHHPVMAVFDAPDRSESVVHRQETNTPLQALTLLNEPTFIEAAKVLGEQMMRSATLTEAVQEAFIKLTGRKAMPQEMEILLRLRENEYNKFKSDKDKLKGWLATGAYRIDVSLDPSQVAANAVVASTIINSDAAITKR